MSQDFQSGFTRHELRMQKLGQGVFPSPQIPDKKKTFLKRTKNIAQLKIQNKIPVTDHQKSRDLSAARQRTGLSYKNANYGTRVIVQHVKCLPCIQLTWVKSLAPHMAPRAPPRVIPKHSARSTTGYSPKLNFF